MMKVGVLGGSGVYDLEPLVGTYINDALGLDAAAARRNSPLHAPASWSGPATICWGEIEPSEFARQGHALAGHWSGGGCTVETFEVPGRNHFDLLFDLGDAASLLGAALRRQVLGRDPTAG